MHAGLDLTADFSMPLPEDLLIPRARLQNESRRARLRLSELALEEETKPLRLACAPVRAYNARLQDLAKDIAQAAPGTTTLRLMETVGRIERLAEVLTQYGQPPRVVGAPDAVIPGAPPAAVPSPPGAALPRVVVAPGRLTQGFVLPSVGLQVLTEREVFGEHAERETKRRKVSAFSPGFRDLK